MKKLFLLSLYIAISLTANAQIFKLHWSQVERVKFGNDIAYQRIHNYDINNPDKSRTLLDGTFQIADSYGSYSEITFVKGKVNGSWSEYDSTGRLKNISLFTNGVLHGKSIEYHQNKSIRKESFYDNGKETGTWKEYDNDGKEISTKHYNNGQKEGDWIQIRKNGNKICIDHQYYKKNIPVGTWKKVCDKQLTWSKQYTSKDSYEEKAFYSNGNIKTQKTYKEGKLNGVLNEYAKDGILKKHFVYDMGVVTLKKHFYSDGSVKSIANYKDSKNHGSYEEYYNNGTLRLQAYYDENYKTGTWEKYTATGSLMSRQNYKDGVEHGTFKLFYKSGNLRKEGSYLRGKADGLFKIYKRDGTLDKKLHYENGLLISEEK